MSWTEERETADLERVVVDASLTLARRNAVSARALLAAEMAKVDERLADLGEDIADTIVKGRLDTAHDHQAVIRQVAAAHGVTADALRWPDGTPRRRREHLVLARANAAWALREQNGVALRTVARLLGLKHHASVLWLVQVWKDRLAGRLAPVTDDQAGQVRHAMTAHGMTLEQACDFVGVGVTRFKSYRASSKRRAS